MLTFKVEHEIGFTDGVEKRICIKVKVSTQAPQERMRDTSTGASAWAWTATWYTDSQ
jgi:hypothetical protein